jgi:predicted DCC family thiol-disulfide oxidoreductase YuxK
MTVTRVILFDGTCNLCDRALQFVIDRERDHDLKFAAIQSDGGRELLEAKASAEQARTLREGVTGDGDPDSVVLIDGDRVYTHSSAALRIAGHLRWPWSWLRLLVVVPRPIRDVVYRWIARHRYRWFGKADACRVPTPELRARFL